MPKEIIAKELLDILVCPCCHTTLRIVPMQDEGNGLQCTMCQRIFPIREGIPVMLLDEAVSPPIVP